MQMKGPPISARARHCLPPDKLKLAWEEFDKLEAIGIICCSNSNVTIPDEYQVPHILDFAVNLTGNKIFFSIDLFKGYNQVLINKN